jgi:hypothetical protein
MGDQQLAISGQRSVLYPLLGGGVRAVWTT